MSTQTPPSDAYRNHANWAKPITHLEVGAVDGATGDSVRGRRLSGPIQGFGKLWQKTYTVTLVGTSITPEAVIATWRANYGSFWPAGNRFYAPITGIHPGEIGLISGRAGGLTLSTGVLVLYADDTSFTFMTPEGHPFAGLITFSAEAVATGDVEVRIQLLIRAQDPLVEIGMALGGHRKEDRMWQVTLTNLITHLGSSSEVDTVVVCVDKHRQWRRAGNIRHDVAIHAMSKPFRRTGRR
jgi:hypothetical protein